MKKPLLLISLSLMCSAFLITGCHCTKGTPLTVLNYPLPNEDTLDLTKDPVSQSNASKNLAYEAKCLEVQQSDGTTLTLNSLAGKMDTIFIDTLYSRASKLASGIGTSYLTALQINYGIDSNYNFVLFFRPLCLTRTTEASYSATYSVTTHSLSTGNPFCRCGTSGTPLSNCKFTVFQEDTARYTKQIRIRHHLKDSTYGTFIATPLTDTMGDIRFVYFPFQELFSEVRDNCSSAPPTYNYLTILNTCIIRPVVVGGAIDSLVKQDIFFGLGSLPTSHTDAGGAATETLSGTFTNMYADLTHMCPPDPVYLNFKLVNH